MGNERKGKNINTEKRGSIRHGDYSEHKHNQRIPHNNVGTGAEKPFDLSSMIGNKDKNGGTKK